MEENSQSSSTSTRNAPRSTRKTAKVTPGQMLEILTQDFHNIEELGFLEDVTADNNGKLIIVLKNVRLVNRVIVPLQE